MKLSKPYSKGEFNHVGDEYQTIRLSEGCPHRCPWCYEWREIKEWKVFKIPNIVRNKVRIIDMNLIAKKEVLWIIKELGHYRVHGDVVHYELVCGIDYRFLTDAIAQALKYSRFDNPHIAWDNGYDQQKAVKGATTKLLKAGYKQKDISVFMICNHPAVSYTECMKKLNLCKYWNVKVNDCYYDNQVSPNIKPVGWTEEEIRAFRREVRKHNHFVNYWIDPELKIESEANARTGANES